MSICRLMILSFTTGEPQRSLPGGEQTFDAGNLQEGIAYAQWLTEQNITRCPVYDYDLTAFMQWAHVHLKSDKNE